MLTAEEYLGLVNQRGKARKPMRRVYGYMLKQRDLFINAYGKLYANKGAMTPGVDGQTVDGTSLAKIDALITELAERKFRWTPVRRTYIPKGRGKKGKRPLGLPTWREKLIQEVIRVILEAYYEPKFSDLSHGYRPGRGCHTALGSIKYWRGTKWFVEADIRGCFNEISHDILIRILLRDFQDESFIKLINGMLKAGYMDEWQYHKTYSGTPQGAIASPILSNIYLNELDKWVEKELLRKFNRGSKRARNRERARLVDKAYRTKRKGDYEAAQKLYAAAKGVPAGDPYDPHYRRLWYVRYADDVLLGFIGPKKEAEQIKSELGKFLGESLKLEMSEEKTLITHAPTQKARFLGYNISAPLSTQRPQLNGKIQFTIPPEVKIVWLKEHTRNGKPIHKSELITLSDFEIVLEYGTRFRGLYNYYKHAKNVGNVLGHIKWVMEQSLTATLAGKHKTSRKQILKQYCCTEATRAIKVESQGRTATFGGFNLQWDKVWKPLNDQQVWIYYGRNEAATRLAKDICEIPDCPNKAVEMHHIKNLATLQKKYKNAKDAPVWVQKMIGRQRKTIAVCLEHHRAIHKGEYDGPSLKRLTR